MHGEDLHGTRVGVEPPGALVGGVAVGLIETYSGVLVGTTFKNLVPFLLLMVLLVFRPQGLFGAAEVKRV